ncbi:MAG: hypothetical protein ACK6D4_15905, partial [Planctomyces sp.]
MTDRAGDEVVWYFDSSISDGSVPSDLGQIFAEAGIRLQSWSGKPEGFPGVMLVSECSERVIECLSFASDSGRLPVYV